MSKEEAEQSQALEPVEQESISFHGQTIIAVRLADGRICVILRWVCESLMLQPGGQVRKIERTATIASELVRVRVQTRGGRQTMPALTLRGFSPWILSINSSEITHSDLLEQERLRSLVVAYQEEAKDVLYQYFVNKSRPALPASSAVVVPAGPFVEPTKPADDAPDEEQAAYYEHMAIWALWKAAHYNQQWRGHVQHHLESLQTQLENEKAVTDLIPEVVARFSQEKITDQQQTTIRGMVQRFHELSGIHQQTIYWELSQAFQAPRYKELLESQYPAVVEWFKQRIEAAKAPKKPRGQV